VLRARSQQAACFAIASTALAVSPGSAASNVNQASRPFRGPGIVLRYSAGLYVTDRLLDPMTNPEQRFVLSTHPLPEGRLNTDGTHSMPGSEVIAELLEEVPPASPDFQAPLRPRLFAPPTLSVHLEGLGGRWGEIPFRDLGRDFYIILGIGYRASAAQVAQVLRALDGMTITAAPPSVIAA
jgi:hypothetical protein